MTNSVLYGDFLFVGSVCVDAKFVSVLDGNDELGYKKKFDDFSADIFILEDNRFTKSQHDIFELILFSLYPRSYFQL